MLREKSIFGVLKTNKKQKKPQLKQTGFCWLQK